MADEVTIKSVLLAEMDQLAKDLSNGDAGNVEKQGKALAYIMRILRPLVEQDSVKQEECRDRMKTVGERITDHIEHCPARALVEKPIQNAGVVLANCVSTSLPWLIIVIMLVLWKLLVPK